MSVPGPFDPLNPQSKAEHDPIERGQRQLGRRLLALRSVAVLAFLVLAVRLWEMQIVQTQHYATAATENRVRTRITKALRGVIYDRNHTQLVFNQPSFDVAIDVEDLPARDEAGVIQYLARLLEMDPGAIQQRVDEQRSKSPTVPVTIATSIGRETLLALKEDHLNLPGVIPVQTTIRNYTDGSLISNVEGYVAPISSHDYATLREQGYQADDKLGKAGIEMSYEDELRGTNGLQHVEVDAGGREIQVIDEVPPQVGHSLTLTIDQSLQTDVTSYLRWGLDRAHCYEANEREAVFTANCSADVRARMARPSIDGGHGDEGAAIVMDVQTGEILALVAFPQYDNNVFSGRAVDQPRAAEVLTRHDNPLIDRALAATAPGSTFKMITAAAALQDHVVAPAGAFAVPACWPGIRFCNWDGRSYGAMTVIDAIAQSNDIWMGSVVAGNGAVKGLGPDRLAWYAQQFGLGGQLGIDLPFEQKGLTPTTAWKAANFEGDDSRWYQGDSLNVAIGQGLDLATPLQMLSVAATVANGGKVMVPHVVKAELDANGNALREVAPVVKQRVAVDAAALKLVAAGMRKGVYTGSSYKLNLRDLQVAGKTGTVEFVAQGPNGQPVRNAQGNLPNNAWWVGFAPYDEPRIAVAVWIHDAGEGADFAAPVARKILARYFHVSDARRGYGCDTLLTTPGACEASVAWERTTGYFSDEHEDSSDRGDPRFSAQPAGH